MMILFVVDDNLSILSYQSPLTMKPMKATEDQVDQHHHMGRGVNLSIIREIKQGPKVQISMYIVTLMIGMHQLTNHPMDSARNRKNSKREEKD